MKLRQTLENEAQSWAMDYPLQVIDWSIQGSPRQDKKGFYVKIGSWSANHWFHVAMGKTEKQTLSYAKRHLAATTRVPTKSFEYIEEEDI